MKANLISKGDEPTDVVTNKTMSELKQEIAKDATFALRRKFTGYCPTLDPRSPRSGQECTHEECWHNAATKDLDQQIELCQIVGIDFVTVHGGRPNPAITLRN